MAYCTQANIEAAVGGATALNRIADPTNTSPQSAATVALIAAAIADADAIIDSFAAGTPGTGETAGSLWSSTPAPATRAAVAISLYQIYVRAEVGDVPRWVEEGYRLYVGPDGEPMKGILGQLASGKISWVTTEPSALQNSGTVYYYSGTCADTARSTNPRRTQRFQLDKL